MFKKLLLFILILIIPTSLYANNEVGSIAQKWFSTFSKKINVKYSDEKEILYFEGFNDKLNELLIVKDFTDTQTKLIEDLKILSNERIFKIKKSNAENSRRIILKTNTLLNDFKNFSYNEYNIFIEDGIWYTYTFSSHLTFPSGTNIQKKDLEFNNIDNDTSLVFLKSDKSLGFVNDYKKVKLISDDIIFGVADKFNLLIEIKDDKKKLNYETDFLYKKLKDTSINLTNKLEYDEKIKVIYNYVLENVEYPTTFSLTDYEIFSGIDTYKNSSGVCEGYTKMFKYMLNFAGINDNEVIRGYVLDAQDFPQVGHARTRIGNKYFDPTFDDPIGQQNTKKYSEYKYYDLPYDLFYANRYTFKDIPEYIKESTEEDRKALIVQNISKLVSKYRYQGYNILKPYTIKLEYGIDFEKSFDIDDLKQIMGSYKVNNFEFTKNGETKSIKTLQYYKIDNSIVDSVLELLNYSFYGYYLFEWDLGNGTTEYRLAYDVEFN